MSKSYVKSLKSVNLQIPCYEIYIFCRLEKLEEKYRWNSRCPGLPAFLTGVWQINNLYNYSYT